MQDEACCEQASADWNGLLEDEVLHKHHQHERYALQCACCELQRLVPRVMTGPDRPARLLLLLLLLLLLAMLLWDMLMLVMLLQLLLLNLRGYHAARHNLQGQSIRAVCLLSRRSHDAHSWVAALCTGRAACGQLP
jgi:hypothetical protein